MDKLKQVIYYILLRSEKGRTRQDLSKLVYYSDTVFFQRHSSTITGQRYVHMEDAPEPFDFVRCLAEMVKEGSIEVRIQIESSRVGGFSLFAREREQKLELAREDIRIMRKVLTAFPEKVVDENRQYPNLYESYVITPVFSEIPIKDETINTKIHVLRKKSLLSFSGKIFRVLYEE